MVAVRRFVLSFDVVGTLVVGPADEATRRWVDESGALQAPLRETFAYVAARGESWPRDVRGLRRAATLLAHVFGAVLPADAFAFNYEGNEPANVPPARIDAEGCAR